MYRTGPELSQIEDLDISGVELCVTRIGWLVSSLVYIL